MQDDSSVLDARAAPTNSFAFITPPSKILKNIPCPTKPRLRRSKCITNLSQLDSCRKNLSASFDATSGMETTSTYRQPSPARADKSLKTELLECTPQSQPSFGRYWAPEILLQKMEANDRLSQKMESLHCEENSSSVKQSSPEEEATPASDHVDAALASRSENIQHTRKYSLTHLESNESGGEKGEHIVKCEVSTANPLSASTVLKPPRETTAAIKNFANASSNTADEPNMDTSDAFRVPQKMGVELEEDERTLLEARTNVELWDDAPLNCHWWIESMVRHWHYFINSEFIRPELLQFPPEYVLEMNDIVLLWKFSKNLKRKVCDHFEEVRYIDFVVTAANLRLIELRRQYHFERYIK